MSKQNALFSLLNWSNCQFKFSHKYTKLAMLSLVARLESGYSLIWGAHRTLGIPQEMAWKMAEEKA